MEAILPYNPLLAAVGASESPRQKTFAKGQGGPPTTVHIFVPYAYRNGRKAHDIIQAESLAGASCY